jgi:hypothetical protein
VSLERLTRMDDEQLGRALNALEPMLLTQREPDVTGRVTDAIRSGRPPRHRLSSRLRLAILIAAALLLLATAAATARLVIDVGGIRIEPGPTGSPSASRPPLTGPAFDEPITLAQATKEAGFRPVVPTRLGRPDRVWLAEGIDPGSVLIAMAWFPRTGLPRIAETPYGATLLAVHGEAVMVAKYVQAPFVELSPGVYWIRGEHEVLLVTADGARRYLVTGHVLVWQDGDLALRLETNLPQADALRIGHLAR